MEPAGQLLVVLSNPRFLSFSEMQAELFLGVIRPVVGQSGVEGSGMGGGNEQKWLPPVLKVEVQSGLCSSVGGWAGGPLSLFFSFTSIASGLQLCTEEGSSCSL